MNKKSKIMWDLTCTHVVFVFNVCMCRLLYNNKCCILHHFFGGNPDCHIITTFWSVLLFLHVIFTYTHIYIMHTYIHTYIHATFYPSCTNFNSTPRVYMQYITCVFSVQWPWRCLGPRLNTHVMCASLIISMQVYTFHTIVHPASYRVVHMYSPVVV